MTEPSRQHGQDRAWVDAALEGALDAESPILHAVQAGKLPALQDIVDGLQANEHRDREILLVAAVYLTLGDLLLKTDPETIDRAAIVITCRELGCLGARLVKSRPRTIRGTRVLIHLADRIIEAREIDSGLALAQGPAEKLLSLALDTLSENPLHTRPSVSRAG